MKTTLLPPTAAAIHFFFLFAYICAIAVIPCWADAQQTRKITLQEALGIAQKGHEGIEVARLQMEISRLLPAKALSTVLPHAAADAEFLRGKEGVLLSSTAESLGITDDVAPRTQWKGTFTLSQPVRPEALPGFIAGQNAAASDRQSYVFTMRQILFAVTRAYFDALKQDKLMEVAEENLRLAGAQADVAKRRFEAGEVPRTDYLRSAVEVSRAQRNRQDTVHRRELANAILKNILGISQEAWVDVEDPPGEIPVPASLEELRSQALDHRNDLERQERLADQAAWDLKRAYAKFLPQFDLEFKELLVDPESITDRNNFWTLLLKFHLPVLEGTDRLLEIKQRKYQLQQEKLRYERLRKDVLLEVQDAWFTAQTLTSTLKVANEETALAQENYDITAKRYKAGEATSVDVSDTFAKLVSARTDMTNLSYEYQVSLYNLQRVVGTFAQEHFEALSD